MLHFLFIFPIFSSETLIRVLGFEVIFFTLLFFLLRKKADSVLELKKKLLNYLFFFMAISTLLYFIGPAIRLYQIILGFCFIIVIIIARTLIKKDNTDSNKTSIF